MTRDEAIDIWRRETQEVGGGGPISALVSLGILKLDEPSSVADRVWEIFTSGFSSNKDDLMKEIEEVGLKIVEK